MERASHKHRSVDEEGISGKNKLAKLTDATSEERSLSLQIVSLSEANQNSQLDSDTLIPHLRRDDSVYSLLKCPRVNYGAIASVNRSLRLLIRSGDLYRLRRKYEIVEFWVFFSCNLLEWEGFDPVSHRWMRLPKMITSDFFECSDKESLGVGMELLVFGKDVSSHVIHRYSILTNSWSEATLMNEGRCLFGSASAGETGIVAGGCDTNGNVMSSAELYSADTGTWVDLPRMNKPRKMCSGVFMNGLFYVIGGIGADNKTVLTNAEAYNMRTRTWVEVPNMFPVEATRTPSAPPLVAVVKNSLYAAFYDEQEVRKYVSERNSWVTLGRLPERASHVNGWGIAFRACGDMLVVIGGPRSACEDVVEVNGWVPDEGPLQWRLLGRKQLTTFVFNCAVMGC